MTNRTTRQRLAQGLSVRWSPALAGRVRRRLDDAIVRRRQRRRIAIVALGLMAVGGLSYAFSRGWHAQSVAPQPLPAATPTPARASAPTPPTPIGATAPESVAAPERRPAAPARRATVPRETVESLFAAADTARLEGRARDAVAPLTAIFTRFPSDPRAAVAAFQLGRILDDDLDDPAAAAAVFSRALALDLQGPLASDAAMRARAALERAGKRAP